MRRKTTLSAIALFALLAALPLLAACHTMQGAGEDVSKTGQAIENGAQKAMP